MSIRFDSEGFRRVWSRVESTDPSVEASGLYCTERQSDAIRALIAKKRACSAECRRLSAKSTGSAHKLLGRIYSDALKHERALQAQYFILTGDTCPTGREQRRTGGLMSGLRELLLLIQECAQALEDLARAAPDTASAQTFRQLAASDRKQTSELRKLIENSIR